MAFELVRTYVSLCLFFFFTAAVIDLLTIKFRSGHLSSVLRIHAYADGKVTEFGEATRVRQVRIVLWAVSGCAMKAVYKRRYILKVDVKYIYVLNMASRFFAQHG